METTTILNKHVCMDVARMIMHIAFDTGTDIRYRVNPFLTGFYEKCRETLKEINDRVDCIGMNYISDTFLRMACVSGFDNIINLLEYRTNNNTEMSDELNSPLYHALTGAAEGGHMKLIEFFHTKYRTHWESVLIGACKGGHEDIVDIAFEKVRVYNGVDKFWSNVLKNACIGKNINIIKKIIKYAVPRDFVLSAREVYLCKNQEIIDIFVSKYVDYAYVLDNAFYGACQCNDIYNINKLIDMGVDNWRLGLEGACIGGHLNIIDLMVEKGGDLDDDPVFLLQQACSGGHYDIIDMILKKCKISAIRGYNIERALFKGNWELVKYLFARDG